MADPLSVAGLVLAIGGVVQILVNYGSDAKDARKDIQKPHHRAIRPQRRIGAYRISAASLSRRPDFAQVSEI